VAKLAVPDPPAVAHPPADEEAVPVFDMHGSISIRVELWNYRLALIPSDKCATYAACPVVTFSCDKQKANADQTYALAHMHFLRIPTTIQNTSFCESFQPSDTQTHWTTDSLLCCHRQMPHCCNSGLK